MARLAVLVALCIATAAAVPAGFTVVRNVKDYGAVGDGVHDDTAAFIAALTIDKATVNRTGLWNASQYGCQTTRPSLVTVPAGTYRLTQTLPVPYYTQLVGAEYHTRATLLFQLPSGASSYRCLDAGTDEGPGHGWYGGANQDNFYRQIRNLIVDTTGCAKCTAVHWMVSQGTVISNVELNLDSDGTGIYMESGSGGFMGDILIRGGHTGMKLGNQQFTFRNITIDGAGYAIDVVWNWVFTFAHVTFRNNKVGVISGANAGSMNFIDCNFEHVGHAIEMWGHATTLYVEGASWKNVSVTLRTLFSTVTTPYAGYFVGRNQTGEIALYELPPAQRPAALVGADGRYPSVTRPNFAGPVVRLNLTNGTDVTDTLQGALNNAAAAGHAVLLPYGTYFVSRTVVVPTGTRLEGQVWTRIAATGAYFANASQPRVMLQLGEPGDIGTMQLADLLLTVQGPAPGAVLVRWNTRAALPGDCGAWDVHFRIGGAQGTGLTGAECPTTTPFPSAAGAACQAAHTLLHLAPSSGNVYLENVWGWVADHDIDSGVQTNIFAGRGLVSEAQHGGVWTFGVAFEHSFLGQFILNKPGAAHLLVVPQTETPYYQPMFPLDASTPGIGYNATADPSYGTAAAPNAMHAYGVYFAAASASAPLWIVGAGHYSFFDNWNSTVCGSVVAPCQRVIALAQLPAGSNASTLSSFVHAANVNIHGARDVFDAVGGDQSTLKELSALQFPNDFCQTASIL
eukprot:CAMPEP_0174837674 /NCGR_PEP_ID=MMETSP1114-20130205/6903_1 /TAXON_ID=312471 /ORGANISM="Neobodo designis, Strain CCAP 1951/1" /LENGTH=737 /DNA_ID=CAMNT_0016071747 /DNA_START=39 /DNA_END=2252 /DNA_ORIENTATION=+